MTTVASTPGAAVELQQFLDGQVYPTLFEKLPSAFPEFRWVLSGSAWVATSWPSGFPFPVGHENPDRLMVYPDRPYWIKVHGHAGVRFLDYVNGGRRPSGEEFIGAIRRLALKVGLDDAVLDRPLSPEEEKRLRVREARRAVLHAVVGKAQDVLWSEEGAVAVEYLRSERGFTDDQIRALGLGLYPSTDEMALALLRAGISPEATQDAGVLWSKLQGFIAIPWADAKGHPLTLYGRWPGKVPPLKKDHPGWQKERIESWEGWQNRTEEERATDPWEEPRVPKTLALPGAGSKASPLYLDRALSAGHTEIVLVEGVFDAAFLQVHGDSRAVASVAAQLSGEQVETLVRGRVRQVFICGDPDGGGDRGTVANILSLSAAGIATYVVPRLPEGLDPDEFVRRDGSDAWKARVADSVRGQVHRAELALAGTASSSPDSVRDGAARRILELVRDLDAERFAADEAEILRRAARVTGRSVALLTGQVRAERRRMKEKATPAGPAGVSSAPILDGDQPPVHLLRRQNGSAEPNVANAITVLAGDARWDGVLAFDDFAQEVVIRRPPPHRIITGGIRGEGLAWRDEDDIETTAWLQREYRLNVRVDVVADAVLAVASKNTFHPVRDYLSGLAWDQTPRLEKWLSTYLGAVDSDYTRAVGRRWLIAAVARVFSPGCKADNVLILEAAQGKKKSTALKALAGRWFTDELDAIGSKDAAVQLQGVWIVELAELDALGRAEISRTKAFISKSFDRFRPPYGRRAIRFDRQCVFAGTVNHDDYLKDETGNRRFWPVRCGPDELDVAALDRDRDQLWAEAVVSLRRGDPWWLETNALVQQAGDEQGNRFNADVWEPLVAEFVLDKPTVTVGQVLAGLAVDVPRQGQVESNRVARCLKALGWNRAQRRESGERVWRYYPPGPVPSPVSEPSPVGVSRSGDGEERVNPCQSPPSPVSPVEEKRIRERVIEAEEGREDRYSGPAAGVLDPRGDTSDSGDTGDASAPPGSLSAAPTCFACRRTDLWTSRSGQVVCRRCHPPASEELVS